MIKAWLIGDKEMVAKFDRFSGTVRADIEHGVARLAIALAAKVKGQKLSDQVLHVRTGRLRRSITYRVESGQTQIFGVVGTNVAYAARHEFGFHGTESVKAHLRTIKQAFGKRLKSPLAVQVRAHSRAVNYPARSFLRSALAEMQGDIRQGLQEALNASASKVFR